MINPVTPWTATVQDDIANSTSIYEMSLQAYLLKIFNAGDSIWLVITWPQGGSIAFRLAFGMNSKFDDATVTGTTDEVLITAITRLGAYRIVLQLPNRAAAIVHYTTTFRAKFPLLIPFWPSDIVPLTKVGSTENTTGEVHVKQVGSRSGQLFFSMTKPVVGSVFYFQNLTAMTAYCEATEVSLRETVGGNWPEIGFQFPVNREKPLPADVEFIISDAFVQLTDAIPERDGDVIRQFLDALATVYLLLPKPEPREHDCRAG